MRALLRRKYGNVFFLTKQEKYRYKTVGQFTQWPYKISKLIDTGH